MAYMGESSDRYLGAIPGLTIAGQITGIGTPIAALVAGPGSLAGPIGAAIGAAIAGVQILISQFGKGRREADAIVPVQNQMGSLLTQINAMIQGASAVQLQAMAQDLEQAWSQFKSFVGQAGFKDGRASTQALNTIGPLVDGGCGYTSKNSQATQYHCGPPGGGEDGVLGNIVKRIAELSPDLAPPTISNGANNGYLPSLTMPYEPSVTPPGTLPTSPAPRSVSYQNVPVLDSGTIGGVPLWAVGAALAGIFILARR